MRVAQTGRYLLKYFFRTVQANAPRLSVRGPDNYKVAPKVYTHQSKQRPVLGRLMHDISFILTRHDFDTIRFCIKNGNFVAATHLLNRKYIPELITSQQQTEITELRRQVAELKERSKSIR